MTCPTRNNVMLINRIAFEEKISNISNAYIFILFNIFNDFERVHVAAIWFDWLPMNQMQTQ